jgi:hypothetical protein
MAGPSRAINRQPRKPGDSWSTKRPFEVMLKIETAKVFEPLLPQKKKPRTGGGGASPKWMHRLGSRYKRVTSRLDGGH